MGSDHIERDAGRVHELVRARARRLALLAIGRSGAGGAAASLAARLPRREAQDWPAALRVRPFEGHRLAIVAHHSADGGLDRGFIYLGESLRALGYDVLVATTAPSPLDALADQSASFAFAVVTRGNEGFDFQSWRRGLEEARAWGLTFDRLILTNGSMYGPVMPIDGILGQMDRHNTWGMTESLDFRRHIQSWWLAFGADVLSHPEFYRYWERVRPSSNKWGTILAHELSWADDLSLAGPAAAYVPVESHRCAGNPLFFAWRELIRDCRMPFLKRSLFGPNYEHIDMTGWQEFLADVAPDFDQSIMHR